MLTTYFTRKSTLTTYYSGPAGPYLDDFTNWLDQRGYKPQCICIRVRGAAELGSWAMSAGHIIERLTATELDQFRQYLMDRDRLFYQGRQHTGAWLGAKSFFEFLQAIQVIPADTPVSIPKPPLIEEFEQWMRVHRGVKSSTLDCYRPHLIDFLSIIGDDASNLDASQLREMILSHADRKGRATVRTRVKATRMFLRFLVATNRCRAGLEAAIPTIADWRLSALPRYLQPEEVEQVIAGCNGLTATGIRNRAILLMLARLGLRASEVAGLQTDHIDWSQGTFSVTGKGRREARLPLPQEVGDAVLRYLQTARPDVDNPYVFLTATAPWRPITRYVVKSVAARAIKSAGITAPSYGAHVLRHSAATAMLRNGATLQTIGTVLRHQQIDTTAHYAKVDVGLLEQVTRKWPGVSSC